MKKFKDYLKECAMPNGELNGLLVSIPDRINALKQSKEAYDQQGWDTSSYDLQIQELENKLVELKHEANIDGKHTPRYQSNFHR